jgi:hypothetical protein
MRDITGPTPYTKLVLCSGWMDPGGRLLYPNVPITLHLHALEGARFRNIDGGICGQIHTQ